MMTFKKPYSQYLGKWVLWNNTKEFLCELTKKDKEFIYFKAVLLDSQPFDDYQPYVDDYQPYVDEVNFSRNYDVATIYEPEEEDLRLAIKSIWE